MYSSNYSFQPSFGRQYANPVGNSYRLPQFVPENHFQHPAFSQEPPLFVPNSPTLPPFRAPYGPQILPPPGPVAIEVHHSTVEEYNEFAEKEVAYKRFRRNDALMGRIMSEIMVPCEAVPITTTKLIAMKTQAGVMRECQRKEAAEIIEEDKKHSAALQNVKERRDKYEQVLQKLTRPITDTQIKRFCNFVNEKRQMRRLEISRLQEQIPPGEKVDQLNPTDPKLEETGRCSMGSNFPKGTSASDDTTCEIDEEEKFSRRQN